MFQPQNTILLQNSYKNAKHLAYLPSKFLSLANQHYCQFPTEKIVPLKVKRTLATLEEILIKQRRMLWEEGLLIIFLLINWKEKKLELKRVKLEPLGIGSTLNLFQLENKIKTWWSYKLTHNLKRDDSVKLIKEAIRRRLSELVRTYLSSEYEIELEELPILLFFK
jgi:mRNA degradation ribonuclease J1/J2